MKNKNIVFCALSLFGGAAFAESKTFTPEQQATFDRFMSADMNTQKCLMAFDALKEIDLKNVQYSDEQRKVMLLFVAKKLSSAQCAGSEVRSIIDFVNNFHKNATEEESLDANALGFIINESRLENRAKALGISVGDLKDEAFKYYAKLRHPGIFEHPLHKELLEFAKEKGLDADFFQINPCLNN
jgi:hypothetical protein